MFDYHFLLNNLGFSELNSLQEKTLTTQEKEWILYANTGTGKTAAFLLPMAKFLFENKKARTLIVAPTRELILQIESVWKKMKTGISSTACYGGHKVEIERRNLEANPRVVFATPGRICDLARRKFLLFSQFEGLVIDEFDKTLELGFHREMKIIFSESTERKRTFLTSATRYFEKEFDISQFCEFNFISKENLPLIKDLGIICETPSVEVLSRVISSFRQEQNIIFVNYREVADDLASRLSKLGHICSVYHGGLPQERREKELIRFTNESSLTLVCTDLGARGLDIPDVRHIVHWQYPESKAAFIHRKGRTGRNKLKGNSYLFLSPEKKLPLYINSPSEKMNLPPFLSVPSPSMQSIYIGGGKKNKINVVDLLGFFCQQGKLIKEEVGKIVVRDYFSIVAVPQGKFKEVIRRCKDKKIKGKKIKIGGFQLKK